MRSVLCKPTYSIWRSLYCSRPKNYSCHCLSARCGPSAKYFHRDIKPDNILITTNGPKLGDFGIAHLQSAGNQTRTQAVMGTYAYMAPEQRMSAKTTGAPSDVYALALTLAVSLVQRPPVDLLESERRGMLEGLPPDIQALICECCDQNPDARPSADSLIQRVELLMKGYPEPEDFQALPSIEAQKEDREKFKNVWSQYVLKRAITRDDGGLGRAYTGP